MWPPSYPPPPHVHLRKEFTPCFYKQHENFNDSFGVSSAKAPRKKPFIKFSLFHFKSFVSNLTLFGTVFKLRNKKNSIETIRLSS